MKTHDGIVLGGPGLSPIRGGAFLSVLNTLELPLAFSLSLSLSLSSGGLCKNTLSEVEAGFQKKLAVKLKSALRTAAEQITSSPSARVSMQTTSKLNRIVSRIAQKFRERLV